LPETGPGKLSDGQHSRIPPTIPKAPYAPKPSEKAAPTAAFITDRDGVHPELRSGGDATRMLQGVSSLALARESEAGADIGEAEEEDRRDHDPKVGRHPSDGQQEGPGRPKRHPQGAGATVLGPGVDQGPRDPAERERRADMPDGGRLVEQPLGKESAQQLAQRVNAERHRQAQARRSGRWVRMHLMPARSLPKDGVRARDRGRALLLRSAPG